MEKAIRKLFLLYPLLTISIFSFIIVGCNNDEDDDPVQLANVKVVSTNLVTSGLTSPVTVVSPWQQKIFVIDQIGTIKIIEANVIKS